MPNHSKVAVTWIEVILVLLLGIVGMGIWAAAARLVIAYFSEQEPKQEEIEAHHGMTAVRRRQAAAEEDWKATLSLRIQRRLEIEARSAEIAALEQAFPALRLPNPPADAIPEKVLETYEAARQQKVAATMLMHRLDGRLHALEALLTTTETATRDAGRLVAGDLESARTRLAWKRRIGAVALQALGLAALLLGASVLLASPTALRTGIHRGRVLAAAALLLAIFCLYELLGAAFAAALGGLLALAGLWTLLRSVPERAPDGR